MNKFLFFCSLLFSLSCLADAKQSNTLNQFIGEWEGTGTQSDGSHWSIRVNSRPDGYFIDYPSLVCGGVWKPIKITESNLVFKEILIYGIDRCLDHGEVVIHKIADNKARYSWSSSKSKIQAAGDLTRKSTSNKPSYR